MRLFHVSTDSLIFCISQCAGTFPLSDVFDSWFVSYLVPESVHHVEQLEDVDEDHGVGGSVQTLLLHLSQGQGEVDQTLNRETRTNHRIIVNVFTERQQLII